MNVCVRVSTCKQLVIKCCVAVKCWSLSFKCVVKRNYKKTECKMDKYECESNWRTYQTSADAAVLLEGTR